MCGRCACTLNPNEYQEYFSKNLGCKDLKWENKDLYKPNYNASPQTYLPVLHLDGKTPVLMTMRWGLVPSYSKVINNSMHTHNARGEGITETTMYKRLLGKNRGVFFVNGYYEWQLGTKVPHYIQRMDGELICIAVLYDHWDQDGSGGFDSFAAITIEPNKDFMWLHDRMPVMLNEEERQIWLDPSYGAKDVMHLIKAVPTETLKMFPVGKTVNGSKNNSPDCIVEIPKKVTLDKWFSPKRKEQSTLPENDEKKKIIKIEID